MGKYLKSWISRRIRIYTRNRVRTQIKRLDEKKLKSCATVPLRGRKAGSYGGRRWPGAKRPPMWSTSRTSPLTSFWSARIASWSCSTLHGADTARQEEEIGFHSCRYVILFRWLQFGWVRYIHTMRRLHISSALDQLSFCAVIRI